MRIGIMSHSGCGGSSVIASELASSLSTRHQVHLITYHRPYFFKGQTSYHLHSVLPDPCPNVGSLYAEWTEEELARYEQLVLDVISKHKIQLLHIHYAVPFLSIATRIKGKLGGQCPKIVLTFHGTDISHYGNDALWKEKIQRDCKVIDCFTTVSRDYANFAQKVFNLDKTPSMIPNLVCCAQQSPQVRSLPSDRLPRLIHVSNFREVKNIPGLIEIYDEIRRKMPVEFWLVGDGPCFGAIQKTVAAREDADCFRLFGARSEVNTLLQQCELFMLCSRAESFSRSAMEAANQGLPCIAPRVPGLRDTVLHESTGLLFSPGDYAMAGDLAVSLLSQPALYKSYSKRCLEHASCFDSQFVSKQYESLFSSLTEGSYES